MWGITMNKNHIIKLLLTKEQKERIEVNAQLCGYVTLSSYLRAVALNHDAGFMFRFNKLYDKIMEVDSNEQDAKDPVT